MTGTIPTTTLLDEADPNSIDALMRDVQGLFSINPTTLTPESPEVEAVVLLMRKHREQLEAAEAAGKQPRQARIQKPKDPESPKLSLEDLGL